MSSLLDIKDKIKNQNKALADKNAVDESAIEKFANAAADGQKEPAPQESESHYPWEQFDSSPKAKATRHIQFPVTEYELAVWNWIVDNDPHERSGRKLGRKLFREKVLQKFLDELNKD
ncbi:hypothetical protein [Spartinivicinus ruber]|uniref:hypothetical protein n=1 Tax=Spartinivicinus ruber TaxID=2683272 RepID=UPI0013D4A868|nr:hypothetical protein [Spartinivicinus ruber]